ncbi:hypothetical protein [Haloferula sp. BvORR071]|uniref:hypothetical protein n=1 Tax=Haloferula sp. BvORR071 TaxID=1396141 RepID=UPI000553A095|nr:hypothetical protein [Haloferula sp. BvORR071]
MADDKLTYELTFKTRSEGTGAAETVKAMRDIRSETDRLNSLSTAEKTRANVIAQYDLDAALAKNTNTTKAAVRSQADLDVQQAKAKQTVRQIREELALTEPMQKRFNAANMAAAGGMNAAKGAGQNLSYQLQDIAVQLGSGVKLSTALGQQLPQLLSGFGAKGAAAGAAISIGFMVYNLISMKKETDEAKEKAKEMKEALEDLINLKAHESTEAYAESVRHATQVVNNLAQAQLNWLAVATQVADANRSEAQSQDDAAAAALRYLAATTGADVSAQMAALERKKIAREAEEATDHANAKVQEQIDKYESLREEMARVKQDAADMEKARPGLDQQASDLQKEIASRERRGKDTSGVELKLKETLDKAAEMDAMLKAVPAEMNRITEEMATTGTAIDQAREVQKSEVKAINAEMESKLTSSEFDQAVTENRNLSGKLNGALGMFEISTPQQAAAAETIRQSAADGVITAEEAKKNSEALKTLLPSVNKTMAGNTDVVMQLIKAMEGMDAKQREMKAKVDGLLNRQ